MASVRLLARRCADCRQRVGEHEKLGLMARLAAIPPVPDVGGAKARVGESRDYGANAGHAWKGNAFGYRPGSVQILQPTPTCPTRKFWRQRRENLGRVDTECKDDRWSLHRYI
jgi:hypothetical protein